MQGKLELENPLRADGDGSVPSSRALPLLPIPYQRLDRATEHLSLMSDHEVLQAIERFLHADSTVGQEARPLERQR
jgi:hypothetical protein